jgi:hypothetical protein
VVPVLALRQTGDNEIFLRVLALFFPCSGNGAGTSRNNRGSNGNYWSATFNSARNARNLNFNSGGVNPQNNNNRYNGFAVRPVQILLMLVISQREKIVESLSF